MNKNYFDTVSFTSNDVENVYKKFQEHEINITHRDNTLTIALDETTSDSDVNKICQILGIAVKDANVNTDSKLKRRVD